MSIFLAAVLMPTALHAINVTVPVLTRASFAAGNDFTIALTEDGRLWAWGNNSVGQLGDGTIINRTTPVPVTIVADMIDMNEANDALKFTKFKSVDAGPDYAMALDEDGNLWGWGSNQFGQILPKSNAPRFTTPVKIPIGPVLCFACGNGRSVAATPIPNNALLTWGRIMNSGNGTTATIDPNTLPATNLLGGLGTYNPATGFFTVTKPATMGTITRLAAGTDATYAIATVGSIHRIWAWGDNSFGQLGVARFSNSNPPPPPLLPFYAQPQEVTSSLARNGHMLVFEPNLPRFIGLAAGDQFALAKVNTGQVYAWGRNNLGQLGTGDFSNFTRPVRILGAMMPLYSGPNGHISAGLDHSLAATNYGILQAWGDNTQRQLGTISSNHSNIPVRATTTTGLRPYAQCTAGYQFSVTLKSDGTLSSWGRNDLGQLGLGHTNPVTLPQNITSLQLYRVDITIPTQQTLDPMEDSDKDGLPDSWEKFYYGNLTSQKIDTIPPAGHVDNLTAYLWGLDPTDIDNDGDGLTDLYELTTSGSTNQTLQNTSNSTSQSSPKSNPKKIDTDGDGLGDKYEDDHGFDPNNADENENGVLDGLDDADGDGLTNQDEYNKAIEDGIPKLKLRAMVKHDIRYYSSYSFAEVDIYSKSLLKQFAILLGEPQYLGDVPPSWQTFQRCYSINIVRGISANVRHHETDGAGYVPSAIADKLFGLFSMSSTSENKIRPDDWIDIKDILDEDLDPLSELSDLSRDGLFFGWKRSPLSASDPEYVTRHEYQMIIEYPYPANRVRTIKKSFINLLYKGLPRSREFSIGEPPIIDLNFTIPANSRISNVQNLTGPTVPFEPPGHTVYQSLLPVDVDIVHPVTGEMEDAKEDVGNGGYVSVQRLKDPDDLTSDATPKTKLKIHAVLGALTTSKTRIKFSSEGRYKIYRDESRTQEVVSEQTEFDATEDVELFFHGFKKSLVLGGESVTMQVMIDESWLDGDSLKFTVVQSEFLIQVKAFIPYSWTEGEILPGSITIPASPPAWPTPTTLPLQELNPMNGKVAKGDLHSIPSGNMRSGSPGFRNAYSTDAVDGPIKNRWRQAPFRCCQTIVLTPYKELHTSYDLALLRRAMTAPLSEHYVKATSVDPSEISLTTGYKDLVGGTSSDGKGPIKTRDYRHGAREEKVAQLHVEYGAVDGALGTTAVIIPNHLVSPDIHWDIWLKVNSEVNPLMPSIEFGGKHDSYPAYEIIVIQADGTYKPIHRRSPAAGALPGPTSLGDGNAINVGRSDIIED